AVAGGSAYFFATDGTHSPGLFKSDGTAAGTTLVRDLTARPVTIDPGTGLPPAFPPGTPPQAIVAAGGKVYFAWNDGTSGPELWVSDGPAAGTRLVTDLVPGKTGSFPTPIAEAGGKLVFTADTSGSQTWGTAPTALYTTDGTAGGTVELTSFAFGN